MEIDKILIGLISGLLAGTIAIYTNYWRTKYSIREQDFSKRIEELIKKIDQLEELSCSYWEGNDQHKVTESKIIGKQNQITQLIAHLTRQYKISPLTDINMKISTFRSSCTGGTFGCVNRELEDIPNRIRDVLVSSEDLKIELYNSRFKLY
ncbi:hypothetical protein [Enterobacter hormaechei]|uniref:hypothetical protein n=1 Tax=Enterobacter hormaechei TaxID=158836 RepID=UPI000A700FAB|nr:hypothetical protein [Enterobacter hormaechei]